ncbi:oligosaccharide flippase family protein [Desulfosporosinus sp. BG]|uniref:oligosaccharide flippase family protein n=1 Tax=Desulfosporosinus sp. BG TaxID=1633135 RepID=UPI000A79376B|nr:oligosaccharide flippase family protein [Desulfosporosinus sp. BG]
MKKQCLVKGAFVLTVASFITKILAFSNSIVLSRVLGPEGIGLKKMVMPFMGLMMTHTAVWTISSIFKTSDEMQLISCGGLPWLNTNANAKYFGVS